MSRILGLEQQQLGADPVGRVLVDLGPEEDDPLAQQALVDVGIRDVCGAGGHRGAEGMMRFPVMPRGYRPDERRVTDRDLAVGHAPRSPLGCRRDPHEEDAEGTAMPTSKRLTLMAVHAHPDDEASSTGGVLAKYSSEGVKTVVVTCTNGAMGDAPGGLKPGDEGFDERVVIAMRHDELRRSCSILGVHDLELLHYQDSGMMGWPTNDAPNVFWQMSIEDAAAPLVALMEHHRPDVVVTYDANGSYGHPDHIQAHRITMHAAEVTGIPSKLYFAAIPRSAFRDLSTAMKAAGMSFGDPDEEGHEWNARRDTPNGHDEGGLLKRRAKEARRGFMRTRARPLTPSS